MCDYSLHRVASRPAKVGDKLVSTSFPHTTTRGFASVDDRNVAVCLLPGTELAFEEEVRCETGMLLSWRLGHTVAKIHEPAVIHESRRGMIQMCLAPSEMPDIGNGLEVVSPRRSKLESIRLR